MTETRDQVGDLAKQVAPLSPDLLCGEIFRRLNNLPMDATMAVVNDARVPVGLVSHMNFLTRYSKPYVPDLFDRRPITTLMQVDPLIVEADMGVEHVAEIVANHRTDALRFGFIICRQGHYLGIGTGAALIRRKLKIMSRRQNALTRAITEAREANRAKSDFLAMISHELRTPLNAVIGFSELMDKEVHGPLASRHYASYVRDILDAGNHLLEVINDILDLSKAEAGQLELFEDVVDIPSAIGAVLRLMRERATLGGLTVNSDIPNTVPPLRADGRKFRQMFFNVLSNAIKFTPPGGKVDVTALVSSAGEIVISTMDTGIGMDPGSIPVALLPFRQIDARLSRKFHGTGLGLPLVKAMIELHGGRIKIDSVVGKGTGVHLIFPASRVIHVADIHTSDTDPPPIAA